MIGPLSYQDPAAIERVEKFKAQIQETVANREIDDIKTVCSTPQGRRFVWNLLFKLCNIYSCSFVPGANGVTEFNEGKRSIGMMLLHSINQADRGLMQKISLEHFAEEQSNKSVKQKILLED